MKLIIAVIALSLFSLPIFSCATMTVKEETKVGHITITKVCIDGLLFIFTSNTDSSTTKQVFTGAGMPKTCLN